MPNIQSFLVILSLPSEIPQKMLKNEYIFLCITLLAFCFENNSSLTVLIHASDIIALVHNTILYDFSPYESLKLLRMNIHRIYPYKHDILNSGFLDQLKFLIQTETP